MTSTEFYEGRTFKGIEEILDYAIANAHKVPEAADEIAKIEENWNIGLITTYEKRNQIIDAITQCFEPSLIPII